MLNRIEGHFISGYGDAADRPDKPIELVPGACEQAEEILEEHLESCQRVSRVADLIEGFETPFGMELLSTVHWVATCEGASNADKAIAMTYAWNRRKRMFSEGHIRLAWTVLENKGWLAEAPPKRA